MGLIILCREQSMVCFA